MRGQTQKRDWGIVIDLVLLLGIVLMAAGLWLLDYRLTIVFAGLVLMTVAVVLARR